MTMIQETSKHKRDLHETVLAASHVQTLPEKVLAQNTHGKGTTPTASKEGAYGIYVCLKHLDRGREQAPSWGEGKGVKDVSGRGASGPHVHRGNGRLSGRLIGRSCTRAGEAREEVAVEGLGSHPPHQAAPRARPPSVPHTHNLGVINAAATNEDSRTCDPALGACTGARGKVWHHWRQSEEVPTDVASSAPRLGVNSGVAGLRTSRGMTGVGVANACPESLPSPPPPVLCHTHCPDVLLAMTKLRVLLNVYCVGSCGRAARAR
ncbi:hypothetical protein E2C01_001045 [Portunus trituberculatus]|uniref:Uncharacterized protein n=1 Tax=Portunus trituberculatus TaxID=210409 RepID=A0A5B7CGV9_PORTR|nr:hypothetical protein [Portunus trituberculatus]